MYTNCEHQNRGVGEGSVKGKTLEKGHFWKIWVHIVGVGESEQYI